MTLHHLVCVVGMGMTIAAGNSAYLMVSGVFIAEISNPPMHLTCMLNHLGLRHTRLYEVCELSFLMLYTCGRLCMGSFICWNICMCPSVATIVKLCGLAIEAQSLHFITKMVPLLKERFSFISKRRSMNINVLWVTPLTNQQLEKLGLDAKTKEKNLL